MTQKQTGNVFFKQLREKLREFEHRMRYIIRSPRKRAAPFFKYSLERFAKYSASHIRDTREKALTRLIMTYHIVEKGLTMPNRRLYFGQANILELINQIQRFKTSYGEGDSQVNHAIGVIKAYWELHKNVIDLKSEEHGHFWNTLKTFIAKHPDVPVSEQPHVTREAFYANKNASFPQFASSRHTLRHYSTKPLAIERIAEAVQLARTTPSACNRQFCHVHCVSDRTLMQQILDIQGGNRGFGHLADKVLIVTADIQGLQNTAERDDLFTNGGMFLMNLCYSLYYHEIAHCILNWSRKPEEDMAMRKLLPIPPSESVIAILTCGETPKEFDVAASPRRPLNDIFHLV